MKFPTLTSRDGFAIEQLNSRYFHALDGLRGAASDQAWAECFTPDGRFRLLDAHGTTIAEAKGTKALVELYASFSGVATTRHWVNNLLMEKAGNGARTTCYIIAMDIGRVPSTIARTGLYTDDLTEIASGWRYTNRTLALDPNSPPPS
jgi:hypothetical protein